MRGCGRVSRGGWFQRVVLEVKTSLQKKCTPLVVFVVVCCELPVLRKLFHNR